MLKHLYIGIMFKNTSPIHSQKPQSIGFIPSIMKKINYSKYIIILYIYILI